MSPQNAPINDAVKELEDRLGIQVSEITRTNDWESLMQQGVLVSLHITRWRAMSKRTLDDLGITLGDADEREAWREFLDPQDLGSQKLLPVDLVRALERLESKGRKTLQRFAINTRWGYFVPVARFAAWKTLNDDVAARYLDYRQVLDAQYDTIRVRAYKAFGEAAKGVYRRSLSLDANAYVPEPFCRAYAARLMAAFRTREEVVSSLDYRAEFGFLPLPSLVAQEITRRDEILQASELEQRELDELRTINGTLARDAASRLVGSFFQDVQKSLNEKVLEVCDAVLATIRGRGAVYTPNIKQLRALIDSVSELNIAGDREISRQMGEIRALVGFAGEVSEIEVGRLRDTLDQIGSEARAALEEIGDVALRDYSVLDDSERFAVLGDPERRLVEVDDVALEGYGGRGPYDWENPQDEGKED